MDLIDCKKICIDCCANDPVDIKAGGPEYIGFDFFVRNEELEDIKRFILEAFTNLNLPFISMSVEEESYLLRTNEIWERKRILKCLAMESEYIKNEAKRNYRQTR